MSGSSVCACILSRVKRQLLSKVFVKNSRNSFPVRTFTVTNSRNMKLVQFTYNSDTSESKQIRVGYLDNDNIVDINKCDPGLPTTLLEILRSGYMERVKNLEYTNKSPAVPLSCVSLVAPIHGPDKILCVALNYADHCKEQNLTPPPLPTIFSKFSSTIIGPSDPLRLRTDITKKVDWEVELAVVIGKTASRVKAEDAYKYILGYTVAQDISSRDWQKEPNGGQFLLGKSQDTFCPIGPCISTRDVIPDPHKLDIKCHVNGVLKQNSNTCHIIHKIPDVIERLSALMTLLPGDILLTGTPGGVGVHRKPAEFLKPGDVVTSEIENIGKFDINVVEF